MMHWSAAYIGEPYAPTLAGNCLGLARRVYRERFGRELVGLLGACRAARRGSLPAVEVEHPRDGDLVVLGHRPADPARHVGIYASGPGLPPSVLHADDERGAVVLTRMRMVRAAWPVVAFLRPTEPC